MWGILAKNRGMWGCSAWCKNGDGDIELYPTKEEAQKVADKYNVGRSPVNCFTQYFVVKYE